MVDWKLIKKILLGPKHVNCEILFQKFHFEAGLEIEDFFTFKLQGVYLNLIFIN